MGRESRSSISKSNDFFESVAQVRFILVMVQPSSSVVVHSSIDVSPLDYARRMSISGCIKKVGELPFRSTDPRLLAGKLLGEPSGTALLAPQDRCSRSPQAVSAQSRHDPLAGAWGRPLMMAFRHRLQRKIRHWSLRDVPHPGLHPALRNKQFEGLTIGAIRVTGYNVHRDGLPPSRVSTTLAIGCVGDKLYRSPFTNMEPRFVSASSSMPSYWLEWNPPFADHHQRDRLDCCDA